MALDPQFVALMTDTVKLERFSALSRAIRVSINFLLCSTTAKSNSQQHSQQNYAPSS